jgi:hypothetical protein
MWSYTPAKWPAVTFLANGNTAVDLEGMGALLLGIVLLTTTGAAL